MVDYNRKESYLGSDKSTVMVDTLATDLDVSTFQIHSSANRDLVLNHHGTGNVTISGMKFPNADGNANYFLKTDGAGNLSWDIVAANGFSNFAVGGQTTVQADQAGDTLTFTSGNGVDITTNASTDTINIAMTPGSATRYVYVATANQTVFSGSDSNSNTLAFSGTQLDVFMNGIKLNRQTSNATTDFVVSGGNTVTLQSAAAAGDLIEIVVFSNYSVSNVLVPNNNLSDIGNATTARANLGISNFGSTLIDDADAATARTTLGLGTMAVETASNYLTTSSASSTYAPLSGATFTGNVFINGSDSNQKFRTFTASNGVVLGLGNNTGSADLIRLDARSTTPNDSFINSGNFGIGTDSPTQILEVKTSSSPTIELNQADTYRGAIRLAGNDLELRNSSGQMDFFVGTDNDHENNNVRALVVDTDSNSDSMVGISGTVTDPNGWRHVLSIGEDNPGNGSQNNKGSAVYMYYNNSGTLQKNFMGAWNGYYGMYAQHANSKLIFATEANANSRVEINSSSLKLMSGVVLEFADGTTQSTAASGGMSSLIADTTPQLGGNLDVNGNRIEEIASAQYDQVDMNFRLDSNNPNNNYFYESYGTIGGYGNQFNVRYKRASNAISATIADIKFTGRNSANTGDQDFGKIHAQIWNSTTGCLSFIGGSEFDVTDRGMSIAKGLYVGANRYTGWNNLADNEIRAEGSITANYSSDINLKENINELENCLEKVCSLRAIEFDWKDDHIESRGGADGYFVTKHDVGVIAQEVKPILPESVKTRKDGHLAIEYHKLIPLLIGAIKDQQEKIKELEEKVNGN